MHFIFVLYYNILSLASIGNLGKNAKELNKFTSKKSLSKTGKESFNLILSSLDNLDIDQAKKKLSDLKLNPNISKELLEAANNANLLTSSTEEVSKGIKSIGKQTSVLDKVKSAFSGLFSIVASHPFITAGVAIGAAAFAGYSAYQQYRAETLEQASSGAAEYAESSSSIQEQIDKVKELRETLNSGMATDEEVYQAKSELLSIQEQLVDSYGKQVEGIDLINGSLEEQIGLMNQISAESANDFLTKNRAGIKTAFEEIYKERDYTLGQFSIATEEGATLADILNQDKYIDSGLTMFTTGEDTFQIEFTGDVTQAEEALEMLGTDLREYENSFKNSNIWSNISQQVSNLANEVQEILTGEGDYQNIVNQALQAQVKADTNLYEVNGESQTAAEWLADYEQAIADYNEALTSGDTSAIAEAVLNYETVKDSIAYLEENTGMSQYSEQIKTVAESLNQAAIAQLQFNEAVQSTTTEGLDPQEKQIKRYADRLKNIDMSDIDFMAAFETDGAQAGEEAVQGLVDLAVATGLIAGDSSAEVQKLVDVLVAAGVLASDTASTVSNTAESVKTDIQDLIALENSTYKAASEASETPNKGDTYASMLSMVQQAKELAESGDVGTDDFKTIAAMFSPTGATDYANWQENLGKIERYFTEDNSGVLNFLEDLSEKTNESGEALANFNEQTGEWSYNIDDLEQAAQQMGMGYEPFMAMFGELEDKGFHNDFFSTPEEGAEHVAELTSELFEAQAALEKLQNDPNQKDNSTAIENKKAEIESLKERIDAAQDSLTQLLTEDPEEKVEEKKQQIQLWKEQRKQYNQLSKNPQYQTPEGRQALKTMMDEVVSVGNELGINSSVQEVATKEGEIRYKVVINKDDAEKDLEEVENEDHETKIKAVVDESELDDIKGFVTDEKVQNKIVKLIGEDEATPIIDKWDEMEPIDKETALTAKDQGTAVIRLWNAAKVLEKHGILTGEDLGTWVIETWNSLTPEQKEAVLSADPDEANAALQEVLGLSGDLDSTTASPTVKVEGVATSNAGINSVSTNLDNLDGKKATTYIYTVRSEKNPKPKTNNTGSSGSKLGGGFNGTFHAEGTLKARAQGTVTSNKTVSIQKDEDALINEINEEIVVRKGKALTFNNGYPTIARLKKGDIVFNHKQTKELKEKGYVTNSHAKIVGGESAFAQGTVNIDSLNAYAGTGTGGGTLIGSGSSGSSSGSNNSSNSNNSNNSNNKTDRDSKKKDKDDKKKENKFEKKWEKFQNWVSKFFDHIEKRLERSSALIDKWTTAAENAVTLSAQQTAYNSAITETQTSLSLNETASSKYMAQAQKVGRKAVKTARQTKKKSDDRITQDWVNDIINKLENGSLDITRYKGKERDVIDSLQEWVDKAVDSKDAISELTDSLQDLYTDLRNLANTNAEEKVDKLNEELDILGTQLDRLGTAAEKNNNIIRQNELMRQTMNTYQSARVETARNLGSASQRVRNIGNAGLTASVNAGQKIEIQDKWSNAWKDAVADYNASLEANATATTNAKKATADYYSTLQENAEAMFNNIASEFEAVQNRISQRSTEIQAAMDLNEAKGYRNSANYYNGMIQAERENQQSLQKERDQLNADLNNKLQTGQVTYGTDTYKNMVSQINDVTNALNESKQSEQEFANAIRELDWSNFDKLQERISDITEESQFFIDELSRRDLVDEDVAGLTDEGHAAMALYAGNYGTAIEQVRQYQDEIDKVRQELSNDPYNETLIDHLQELEEAQRDVVSSANDMKDAMIDLTSQALEAQKTALQEIISDYQEMMEYQNDAYDYQKSISDMVTDINNVQKQLSVYAGDDSEEARANIQQLQSDLRDKQESLEDTQRQKLTSDINNMFDDLMENYSDYIDTIIDNLDDNFDRLIDAVNMGLADSKETILSLADKLGINVSDELSTLLKGDDILSNSSEAVGNVTSLEDMLTEISNAKSSEEVDQIVTRLSSEESNRKYFGEQGAAYIAAQQKKQELEAQQAAEAGKQSQMPQSGGGSSSSTSAAQNNAKLAEKAAKYIHKNMDPAKKKRKELSDVNKKIYDMTGGQTLSSKELEGLSKKVGVTHNNAKKDGNLYQKLKEIGMFDGGWRIRKGSITHVGTVINNLESFAKGTKSVQKDMLAEIGEEGSEIVYRMADGSVLTPLGKGDMVFTHDMSKNLWELAQSKPLTTYPNLPKLNGDTVNNSYGNNTYADRNVSFTFGDIVINGVENADDLRREIPNIMIDAIQNKPAVQGALNDVTDNHLLRNTNSLRVNRWR